MQAERGDLILGAFVVALMAVAIYPLLGSGSSYDPSEKCSGTATILEEQWGANYTSVSCDCAPATQRFRSQLDTPEQVQNVSLRLEQLSCTIEDDSFPDGEHTVTVAIRTIEGGNGTVSNSTVNSTGIIR